MINIDFSNLSKFINTNFYDLFKCKSRYLLSYGGAGSSKSYSCIQKMILRSLLNKEKFLFLRKYNVDCRKTVFSLTKHIINQFNLNSICKIKESMMIIDFINGSQIIHIGMENPESVKSIPNISSVFLEEATDFNYQDLQQLSLRIRGKTSSYKQLLLAFNPVSSVHWIYKMFFEEKVEDCTIMHSTYKDNRFLDSEYIKVLDNIKDNNLRDIYRDGKFSVLEHQIFKNYEIVDSIDLNLFNNSNIRFAIDFGFHHAIMLLVGFYKDNIYILNELHCKDIISNDFLNECHKRLEYLNKINKKINHKLLKIICDCEDPSTIELFRKSNLSASGCKKNKNSIQDSINWLKNRNIYIHKDCKNIIEEISSYVYKKDNKTNIIYDEPDSKCKDHSLDALRYSMEDFIRHFKLEYSIGKERDTYKMFD